MIDIKKNILDLQYSTYLQYYTIAILSFITYIIGILIALVTKQVDFTNTYQTVLITFVSAAILIIILLTILTLKKNLQETIAAIKALA